jgi:HAD superfamily hydrolase (TIGR01490 family)
LRRQRLELAVTSEQPTASAPLSAAFFDLDKTLMQGSSAFQFGRAARRAGIITRRQFAQSALANYRFRMHGATDEYSFAVRDAIAQSLQGVRVRDLERLGVSVVARILPRLYPQMVAIAHDHQDAGRRVYIVTAAAHELAAKLADVMGFDGAVGSHLSEVSDGHYTGKATGAFIYGAAKALAVSEIAQRDGIDLAASYAYTDSASDLPMLELVGHPVTVNPDAELSALAREHEWEVLHLDPLPRRLRLMVAILGSITLSGAMLMVALHARRRWRRLGSGAPVRPAIGRRGSGLSAVRR